MATPTTLPASFTTGQVLTAAQMNNLRGAFRILQVVQTVKTDTFSTTSTTYTNVTGLSATITPSATSSKVLIVAQISQGQINNGCSGHFRISGGNATTYVGDAAGSRARNVFGGGNGANMASQLYGLTIVYLDSPSTTSATTYQVQGQVFTGNTLFVNRSQGDVDDAFHGRGASSITVMEVSA